MKYSPAAILIALAMALGLGWWQAVTARHGKSRSAHDDLQTNHLMESPENSSKAQRVLRVWERTRIAGGVLAIAAVVYMIARAVIALNQHEDAWVAMKWPLIVAVALIWLFVRSTKKILECRSRIGR